MTTGQREEIIDATRRSTATSRRRSHGCSGSSRTRPSMSSRRRAGTPFPETCNPSTKFRRDISQGAFVRSRSLCGRAGAVPTGRRNMICHSSPLRAAVRQASMCYAADVGAPRVRVADVGGEEFEEADAGLLAGGGDQGGDRKGARGQGARWFMTPSQLPTEGPVGARCSRGRAAARRNALR